MLRWPVLNTVSFARSPRPSTFDLLAVSLFTCFVIHKFCRFSYRYSLCWVTQHRVFLPTVISHCLVCLFILLVCLLASHFRVRLAHCYVVSCFVCSLASPFHVRLACLSIALLVVMLVCSLASHFRFRLVSRFGCQICPRLDCRAVEPSFAGCAAIDIFFGMTCAVLTWLPLPRSSCCVSCWC